MRYFTADTHFNHKGVIAHCNRPWVDTYKMNEGLIANWNSVVTNADEVFVLGDFSFGGAVLTIDVLSRLNGRKYLVTGNHDWKWKNDKWCRMGFEMALSGTVPIRMNGDSVLMGHFPYVGDHTDQDRYAEQRPVNNGSWLLHGHVHSMWKIGKSKQINVGVDVWDWTPVPETTLLEIMHGERPWEKISGS